MWHAQSVHAFAVDLVPLSESELERLRAWRNSVEVATQMLSQTVIDEAAQRAWFERVRGDRSQAQFVIAYKGQPIGACNLKSVGGAALGVAREVEAGFYVGEPRYRGSMLAFFPALALNGHAFEAFGAERIVAKVKPDNHAALRFNEQLGYVRGATEEARVGEGLVPLQAMTLDREGHVRAAAHFSKFIR
jgi:RimJ/RimL family protein N-acetyltransferase